MHTVGTIRNEWAVYMYDNVRTQYNGPQVGRSYTFKNDVKAPSQQNSYRIINDMCLPLVTRAMFL